MSNGSVDIVVMLTESELSVEATQKAVGEEENWV
jgi:hypothetical protein